MRYSRRTDGLPLLPASTGCALESLESTVQQYLADCSSRNLSPRTLEFYRQYLGHLIQTIRTFGAQKPADVTGPMVLAAVRALLSSAGVATAHAFQRSVKAYFNWLVREGIIEESPLGRMLMVKVPTPIVEALSCEQVRELLAQPDRRRFTGLRDHAIMGTMLDTGLRRGECVQLADEDLDLATRCLCVRHGKGPSSVWCHSARL